VPGRDGGAAEFGDSKYRACPLLREMVAAGRLGRKTGQGVYHGTALRQAGRFRSAFFRRFMVAACSAAQQATSSFFRSAAIPCARGLAANCTQFNCQQ
jgi:3-hydroxyacyl-CoA dehydrogenase